MAAARHAKCATQARDRMAGPLRRDESEPYRFCFAKKAFFRMSRSSLWALEAFAGSRHERGFLDDPQLFAQARQLLALGGRQSSLAARAIRLRPLDPAIQRGACQIEVARDTGDSFPFRPAPGGRLGP
jgi:hypothetical protein